MLKGRAEACPWAIRGAGLLEAKNKTTKIKSRNIYSNKECCHLVAGSQVRSVQLWCCWQSRRHPLDWAVRLVALEGLLGNRGLCAGCLRLGWKPQAQVHLCTFLVLPAGRPLAGAAEWGAVQCPQQPEHHFAPALQRPGLGFCPACSLTCLVLFVLAALPCPALPWLASCPAPHWEWQLGA